MFKSTITLVEAFQDIVKKSKEECGDNLEKIRQLILIHRDFWKSLKECSELDGQILPKYANSLIHTCYLELYRISGHILFLTCNGLYRNAYGNMRYALESIVQALYLDTRHSEINIPIKIVILKEIWDKRDYHSTRLIQELEIDFKDKLKREYRKLSQTIHPSHQQTIATLKDVMQQKGVPVTINCEEVSKIYNSMKRMYDIFFFLFISYFPEMKDSLKKNSDFIKSVKAYNLSLLSKGLKIQLGKKGDI